MTRPRRKLRCVEVQASKAYMDRTIARITEYACNFHYADLPDSVVHECKRRLIDTIGCAMGAYHAQPSVIARMIAHRVHPSEGARVVGGGVATLPELAAFANGVMARYLDGNDTYPGGGGHPSDTIAAALAAADAAGSDGRSLITATTIAYEIYDKLFRSMPTRSKGFDNVLYVAAGSAAAAARLLQLGPPRTANAISLAITSNLALGATRHGELSMWKGCAAANAARNAVFAALLARAGMTAPAKPVEGPHGLWALLGKSELAPFATNHDAFSVTQSSLKCYLAEYHSQAPIALALELRPQVKVAEIEKITIQTYWFAWHVIGSEREKWRPMTRETADHSLPYVVAAVLVDGCFSADIFSEERLRDPRIHALSDRIVIEENPSFTRQFPERVPCRMEIVTRSGERKVAESDYPRGHRSNPMNDREISEKFLGLAERLIPAQSARKALDALWRLECMSSLTEIFEALHVKGEE